MGHVKKELTPVSTGAGSEVSEEATPPLALHVKRVRTRVSSGVKTGGCFLSYIDFPTLCVNDSWAP